MRRRRCSWGQSQSRRAIQISSTRARASRTWVRARRRIFATTSTTDAAFCAPPTAATPGRSWALRNSTGARFPRLSWTRPTRTQCTSRWARGPPTAASLTNSLYRIMKTTDAGVTWTALPAPGSICLSEGALINYLASSGDYHMTLAADPANADTVYAAGICMIVSNDGGNTWAAIAQGDTDGPHRDHHGIAFDAAGRLLDGNDGGIWRLDNPVTPMWTNLNGNLQITQLNGLALHPTNPDRMYAGTHATWTTRFAATLQSHRFLPAAAAISALPPLSPNRIYQITRISSSSPHV